jgi:putative ABC transport system permease protein
MVAVSVSVGMTLMIASFRHTVQLWLEATLQGDIYISAPAFTGTVPSVILDPKVVSRIAAWPGVRQVDFQRSTQLDSTAGQVRLAAVSNANIGRERLFMHLWVTPEEVWPALQQGSILITEPLARRLNMLERGKSLTLFTQGGWKTFPIIGIYYDYATSDGTVMMALDTYRRLWADNSVTAIDLRLQPGVNPDELVLGLQSELGQIQHLVVRSNQGLRSDVLLVFDRTFAITAALRLLATIVAFIGVLNTLLLLQLEKQREMGILRALGLSGRQLWRLILLETGLMGLVAGLLAMPTGYGLALILIYVINQRSFGWTLQPDMPPAAFLQALGVALAAALLSGILPAYRLSRMAAAEAIRYE